MPVVRTIGHGSASQDQLTGQLRAAAIGILIDVRIAPGSRTHPHVARVELERWLPDAGIGYRWEPRLGGFRRPSPDSPDVVWRNESFRGYAAHLRTPDAQAAIADLVSEARQLSVAVMCSETVWWRCHRRLLADALVLWRGCAVAHLMHDGRLRAHVLTDGVRQRSGDRPVYDVGMTGRLEL